jgi:hypothetical protein
MKQAVATKKMPPWFADPAKSHAFRNDPSLTAAEVATFAAWADTGAKEGRASDAPAAVSFPEGWMLGKPDVVLEMPVAYEVPAKGEVEYQYIVFPAPFKEDTWVAGVEARPGNRSVVHHIIAFIREPGSSWLKGAEPGKIFVPSDLPKPEPGQRGQRGLFGGEFLVGYAPGTPAEVFGPGRAKLIKGGSDIIFQLHYTAKGEKGSDRSKIGIILAKQPPTERVMTLAAANGRFAIPPGAENHQVDGAMTIHGNAKLLGLAPHMHVRGKSFAMRLAQPDGSKQDLLHSGWDFNWQLWYEFPTPLELKPGSVVEATGWYDNSANNPNNPDPKATVRWGDQSWVEMMIGFFNVAFDAGMNPMDLMRPARPQAKTSGPALEF